MIKAKTFLVCFLLIMTMISVIMMPSVVGWWDTDWDYYKECNISNAQNNYQIKIVVGKGSGDGGDVHCEDHCLDNFGDIRFIDADDTNPLDYWLQNYTSGVQATFWVELPSDASSDNKILMYYGYSSATTTSNGANTFIAFDDEDWSTDWTETGTATITASTTRVFTGTYSGYIAGGSDHVFFDFGSQLSSSIAVDFFWYVEAQTSARGYPDLSQVATNSVGSEDSVKTRYDNGNYQYYDGSWHTACTVTADQWTEITWCDIDWSGHTYDIYKDGSLEQNDASFRNNVGWCRYYGYDHGASDYDYVDALRVRYWSATLGWSSFGSEQTQGGGWVNSAPTLTSESPTNQSTYDGIQPRCSVYVGDADGNESTCDWYTSTNGVDWTWRQQNTSILNETIRYDYTGASSYGTRYYWKVSANDTHDNTSEYYYFDTNDIFTSVTPAPSNGSTGVEIESYGVQTNITTDYSDNSQEFNYQFWTNESGSWIQYGGNYSVTEGTYRWKNSDFDTQSTTYYWSVNITDVDDEALWTGSEIWTMMPLVEPSAIYDSNSNKIFIGYTDSGDDPHVRSIDLATFATQDKEITTESNYHNCPALYVEDGYIHSINCYRNSFDHYYCSVDDISGSWSTGGTPSGYHTQPQLRQDPNNDDNVWMVSRYGSDRPYDMYFHFTDDGGVDWDSTKIADGYTIYGEYNLRIYNGHYYHEIIWYSDYDTVSGNKYEDMYYIYSPDNGTTWYDIDGDAQSLPLDDEDSDCLIWEGKSQDNTDGRKHFTPRFLINPEDVTANKTYVAWEYGNDTTGIFYDFGIIDGTGGTFTNYTIENGYNPATEVGGDYDSAWGNYHSHPIYVSGNTFEIYIATDTTQSDAIDIYQSTNGGQTWSKKTDLQDMTYQAYNPVMIRYAPNRGVEVAITESDYSGDGTIYIYGDYGWLDFSEGNWWNYTYHFTTELPLISFTVDPASPSDQFDFIDWTLSATKVGLTTQYNVSEDNSSAVVPTFTLQNTGNVDINVSLMWLSSPTSGVSMKYNTTYNAPNPTVNTIPVSPNKEYIIENLAPTDQENFWLWLDFVNVEAGNGLIDVRFTSVASP